MQVEIQKGLEIRWNGSTVWIAAPDGGTIGRFSAWGMDIHHTTEKQLETGVACNHCTHELPKQREWTTFLQHFQIAYGIVLPAAARPSWLPVTARLDLTGPKKRPPARLR